MNFHAPGECVPRRSVHEMADALTKGMEMEQPVASAPVPTLGRIVLYMLTAAQAKEINHPRKVSRNSIWSAVGNEVIAGQPIPMMIVAVWGDQPTSAVNGKLLLDGTDDYWVTSVSLGTEPGSFRWPPRV